MKWNNQPPSLYEWYKLHAKNMQDIPSPSYVPVLHQYNKNIGIPIRLDNCGRNIFQRSKETMKGVDLQEGSNADIQAGTRNG